MEITTKNMRIIILTNSKTNFTKLVENTKKKRKKEKLTMKYTLKKSHTYTDFPL